MRTLLIALALAAAPAVAGAQSYNTYDPYSGNFYSGYTSPYSGYGQGWGHNPSTSSQWQWNTTPQGQWGFDRQGRYWNYDRGTNSYWRSDGKFCSGGFCY